MIRKLVRLLEYEDHLRKTQQDWESRWENVQELITFASEVESEVTPPEHPSEHGGDVAQKISPVSQEYVSSL